MTAYEAYLEGQAVADARKWLAGLDDEAALDLFEDRGPINDRFEDWLDAGRERARDLARDGER